MAGASQAALRRAAAWLAVAALAVPVGVASLRLEAERRGLVTLEQGVLAMTLMTVVLVGAVSWWGVRGLARALGAADAAHHPTAERNGIALDEPEDTGLGVVADPARLQLVLGHLLGNALKFTPAGGRVTVSSRREGAEQVRVEVQDTGVGLTRKQMEGLWKPFGQAHDKAQRTDSGLGLYVSKGIVELHGGTVGCESPGPGKGAAFWFTLPLATGHVDPLARPKQEEAPAEPKRRLNPTVREDGD